MVADLAEQSGRARSGDKNNLQVADVIIRWIDEHVEDSSGLDH